MTLFHAQQNRCTTICLLLDALYLIASRCLALQQDSIQSELEQLKKQCKVIRVLVHTQIKKISNWGQKKAHMLEVQVRAHALPSSSCFHTAPAQRLVHRPCTVIVLVIGNHANSADLIRPVLQFTL